jgi:hypothetical protein
MAENTTKKIKIITAPDLIFDRAHTILVIAPGTDLKTQIEKYALEVDDHVNIYLYKGDEADLKWLLTTAKLVDYILIDIDNCTEEITHFLSYILSFPNTYYRCLNMRSPWELLNKNRFYDFPKFIEDSNERT